MSNRILENTAHKIKMGGEKSHIILILLILVLCHIQSIAQKGVEGNLQVALTSAENDSVRLRILLSKIDSVRHIDIEEMLVYLKAFERLENSTNYTFIKGAVANYYGYYYLAKGEYENSYFWYSKALKKVKKHGNKRAEININNDIGSIFYENREYYRAYDHHKQAYEASVESGDTLYHGYYNMGLDLIQQKEYDKAIKYFRNTEKLLAKHHKTDSYHTHLLGDSYLLWAKCLRELNQLEPAEKIATKAIRILSEQDVYLTSLAEVYTLSASIENIKGNHRQSYVFHNKSIESANKSVFPNSIFKSYLGRAKIYLEDKKYKKVVEDAKIALNNAATYQEKVDVLTLLVKANSHIGTNKETYKYTEALGRYSDSLHFDEEKIRIRNLVYKNNILQLESENHILEAESLAQKQTLKHKCYVIIAVFALILFMLSIVLLFLFSNHYKKQSNQRLNLKVRKHTASLEHMNFKLTRINQELESFTYVTSQDLREPIRKIGKSIEALQEEGHTIFCKQSSIYFNFINNGLFQMEQLIDDVLTFAQFSSDKIEIEAVNLQEVIQEAMKPIELVLKERKAFVDFRELPVLYSNKAQLRMIFKNLIENGTKYNKSETPTIKILYQKIDAGHCIEVIDNGIGIAPKDQEKIFGRFQRLDENGTTKGTGLGLTICKDIVEAFNGEISIESELGLGTKFIIILPVLSETKPILELVRS